tara:strand:+ start:3731 stop:4306 length:576 start_codon:yes stop_codon:yes gene_type:complete
MSDMIKSLTERIRALEAELETELENRRADLTYRIENGRAVFDAEIARRQAAFRVGLLKYVRHAPLMTVLTAPLIYSLILPLLFLDLMVSLYQAVCFPVYGIDKVRRGDHIVFDRQRLHYLNGLEKLNCVYCSYGNGLLAYAGEIASRTEAHWCPIKHAQRLAATHRRYAEFADYGDAEGYRQRIEAARRKG